MSQKPVRMSDVPYEKTGTRRRIFSASLCRLQAYARLWIHDTDILIATPVQFLAAPVTEGHEFALQGSLTPWTDIISGFSANIGKDHAFLYAHRPSISGGRLVRFIRHTGEPGYISGYPFHKLSNPPYCVTSFVCRKLYVISIS